MTFEKFLADMGERPSRLHTIERRDNAKGYTPRNCEWNTRLAQANNRISNHVLTNRGRSMTISQWARETKILKVTILARLNRGWTPRKALETTVHA
jgi:hypothetical protein